MSSIGRGKLHCTTPKCTRVRPYWSDFCVKCRNEKQNANKLVPDEKKQVGTVDFTPTWQGVLPILIAAIQDGSEVGKNAARVELERMAKLADAYVESQKAKKD